MSSARTYRCAACGGEVDEGVRHCPYCRAPVASVRCGNCFHMNVPHARHCTACGRELGLEPILEPGEPECPDCGVALHVFTAGPGRLFDCARCGAQFVEHALLRDLLERRETYAFGSLGASRGHAVPPQPVRYLPCPCCRELMNRKNFGGTSGVIVDVCAKHGVWFDAGELPRVMRFVEEGGLARARAREAERQRQEHMERRVREATASQGLRAAEPETGSFVDDLGRAGAALLGFVLEQIKR